LRGHHGAVYALSVSGNRLFSGSYDATIKVWDLEKLQNFQTLQRHTSSVESLVSSNGFTYSGSADALIKIWR